MEKKFQVFISSTYEDLKIERKAVEETIIRAGDFPVGMEAFPAADEEQFEFIKSIIDSCDYYILIISARYGTISQDGKSYTEKEYDYAVSKGIPVLIMLREDRDTLPANIVESDSDKKEKLEEFITRATANRMRKGWSTIDGLKLSVREALDHAKATKPRPGWIRGDHVASSSILEQLAAVQKENIALQHKIHKEQQSDQLQASTKDLEAKISINGSYYYRYNELYKKELQEWNALTTFLEIFKKQSPNIAEPLNVDTLSSYIAKDYSGHDAENDKISNLRTSREAMNQIRVQFEALRLIQVYQATTVAKTVGTFWQLTDEGKNLMHKVNLIRVES